MTVKEVLKVAASIEGYKAYEVEGYDTFGFIITPSDNILAVNKGTRGGISLSFEYVSSRESGSGCECFDDATFVDIDQDYLVEAEKAGEALARSLGAKKYADSYTWMQRIYWAQKGLMRKVTA